MIRCLSLRQKNKLAHLIFTKLLAAGLITIMMAPFLTFFAAPTETLANHCPIWPPFFLDVTPTQKDGQIIYDVDIFNRVNEEVFDLEIRVPLPEGTRFIRAEVPPQMTVGFDGENIIFKSLYLGKADFIERAFFVVEPLSATQNTFTTQPWVGWKGVHGGAYFADPVIYNLNPKPPEWTPLAIPNLNIDVEALVGTDMITYTLYPQNKAFDDIVNTRIHFTLPEGTRLISSEGISFTIQNTDNEVYFDLNRLPARQFTPPVTVTVAIRSNAPYPLNNKIWSQWNNANEPGSPLQSYLIEDVEIQAGPPRQILFDLLEDVASSSTDMKSADVTRRFWGLEFGINLSDTLQAETPTTFFTILIDTDTTITTTHEATLCEGAELKGLNLATNPFGPEYLIEYDVLQNGTRILTWDGTSGDFESDDLLYLNVIPETNRATLLFPEQILDLEPPFRWSVISHYSENWPEDILPNEFGEFNEHIGLFPTSIEVATSN